MAERTAVYRLFAADDTLLYIGVAKIFGIRWHRHAEVQPWWAEVDHQAIRWFAAREDAMEAEALAIRAERPRYNIVHNSADRPRESLADRDTGLPVDEHPRLQRIRAARVNYDKKREQLFRQIMEAIDAADELPEADRRKLGPSAVGRAAGFTREYIAIIRDGKRASPDA